MQKIILNRAQLYEKAWSVPIKDLCAEYDVDPEGLERICKRLNVPVPEANHWKKVAANKKLNVVSLPEKGTGVDTVALWIRDDHEWQNEQIDLVKRTLKKIDPNVSELADYSFDPVIVSTREGIVKNWEERAKYHEKNKLLAISVSSEVLGRALQLMDLLIKVLRFKGHNLIVEQRQTTAVIYGEKIQISLNEKDKRVEYLDEHNRQAKQNHPAGLLFFKKEGYSSYSSKTWGEGPKKGSLEDNILQVVDDLIEIARVQKREHEESERRRIEREEKERLQRERLEKQKQELAKFRGLMLGAHRVALAKMMREYIDAMEAQAIARDKLTQDLKDWIIWARQKADWYDPTVATPADDFLEDVDIENLRVRENTYGAYGYSNYETKENNFWKPWYLK